ncbi:pyrroline-5-carboxylate reductase [Kosakonia radicincitans DSM 16656]|uniref:pyrroline-5-carboxylate reductase family protein n=1 Tax=Kosakonia TaxID=1330547 RepID=UPI000272EE2A|nr:MULTISPECIES: pyrroline-5-carboxylate reductase [Kosakonia]ARD63006.1 pyrroline-5-carboxylate reductase [Kosakonia radicincitans DSM 16656]PTA87985.1 pyrroline-5-carboxylate reductase [Kosakonia sp. H7A]SET55691.1 pyrroline-5-carboxylate reductase [Kosakonia radicincitans]SKC08119.1 pyrroline-5-carboxylate reductase [Kosakonia radicincitans]
MANVHFIGAGQMAEAIIRASLETGKLRAEEISLEDIDAGRIALLTERYGLVQERQSEHVLREASLVVLGIRPQDDLVGVAARIQPHLSAGTTVVSLIAGVTLLKLEAALGAGKPIARVIPNTLTDTGFGYSGVVLNAQATPEQVEPFLTGFGKVLYLPERLIDIFTGFGVAGPNYIYYFIESLTDAGVLAGLSRAQASEVVLENLQGAVEMLRLSQKHPRQLLDINNSPAGVGIHGLYELNNSDFAAGLQRSVLAAVKRTRELGEAHSE